MIHRAPFGSMERFVAVLLEHCGGNLPFWLAPEQFAVLSISDKYNEYAEKITRQLTEMEFRGYTDLRNEKIGKKIRDNELKKIPYMLIVGEKEMETNTVAVRKHGKGDMGTFNPDDLLKLFKKESELRINL
jgi:threonyl-tRNA synthetase